MKTQDINALETRLKATSLLLIFSELDGIELVRERLDNCIALFDSKNYDTCKKAVDLLDSLIVEILIK